MRGKGPLFKPVASFAALLAFVVVFQAGGALAGAPEAHMGPVPDSSQLFPQHAEVMTRLDSLAEHPWMSVHKIGESGEGRDIRLVEVVDPDSAVPLQERAVTLLLTQQHGNEPAGTPAVLDLLDEIAAGEEIRGALSNQVLLVLPMANPDGADENARTNADGVDTNRDHNHLETKEALTMHSVLNAWPVHVALDHHEYGGTGLGNPVPVRVYDYDLTTLVPTHAGAHPVVMTMAKNLMYDGIWPLAEKNGYSVNEYGEATAAGEPLGHLAGGPDPGILRNHLGLHHTAGILIETRIDAHDNPFHDAERREHVQYVTMTATLEYVSEHAGLFVAMREQAMEEHARAAPRWYDEGDWRSLTADPLEEEQEARERIPAAFRISGDPGPIVRLFEDHGLPVGALEDGGVVHNVDHSWPVHAAAMLAEASSRRVLDAEPAEAVPVPDPETQPPGEAASVPGVPAIVFVFVAFAVGIRSALRGRAMHAP